MKSKIYLFGIPTYSKASMLITCHHDINDGTHGTLLLSTTDNSEDTIIIQTEENIKIGDIIHIAVMSNGIEPYNKQVKFTGGDVSHILALEKEENTQKQDIIKDWDYTEWQQWNPDKTYDEGTKKQNQFMSSNKINTEPLWQIYYESSKVDYLERFHRLWIGLNAYASYHSSYTQDGKKIFDFVNNQSVNNKFHHSINFNRYTDISNQLLQLKQATGVDTTSNVLRLDITNSNPIIDFMEQCKLHYKTLRVDENLVNDFIFLDKDDGIDIFNALYIKYHTYLASEEGITNPSNFSEIFDDIKSPKSIKQIGRLVFRNHLESDTDGSLFNMNDFYQSSILQNLYSGIPNQTSFEQIDSLFFRYLYLLYKFRSAYFHGDFILNQEHNELAKFAYLSLLEIYPET